MALKLYIVSMLSKVGTEESASFDVSKLGEDTAWRHAQKTYAHNLEQGWAEVTLSQVTITTTSIVRAPIASSKDAQHHFVVTWKVDVFAKSHQEAAEKSKSMQLDPNTQATVFNVTQKVTGTVKTIDLHPAERH